MKRIAAFLVALLIAAQAHAACTTGNCPPSSLPVASALGGTESIPADQSGSCSATGGTCQTTPAAIVTYVNGHAVIPLGTGVSGNLLIANAPSIASPTVIGNYSGSTGTASTLNPLQIANMQAAVLSVRVVATSNIATLSGSQTIDGIALAPGETALLTAQTSSVNDGIYVVQTGAWTRAANFPAAYVIAQNCDLKIDVTSGTVGASTSWVLGTTSGALTIGTSALSFVQIAPTPATISVAGAVKITSNTHFIVSSFSPASVVNVNDCASYSDGLGSMSDVSNPAGINGPCLITDAAGHPFTSGATPPTVTGTGCTLGANSGDVSGNIVATGADTCTLTWGGTWTYYAPNCTIGNVGTTVLATLTALPTTTSAIFHTAAAGTFTYYCSN